MIDILNLVKILPPQQMSQFLHELLNEFKNPLEFRMKYGEEIKKYVQIEGIGLKPIAVTLGGLMSIAGAVVSCCLFDLKYIITSIEVKEDLRPKILELLKRSPNSAKYLRVELKCGSNRLYSALNSLLKDGLIVKVKKNKKVLYQIK